MKKGGTQKLFIFYVVLFECLLFLKYRNVENNDNIENKPKTAKNSVAIFINEIINQNLYMGIVYLSLCPLNIYEAHNICINIIMKHSKQSKGTISPLMQKPKKYIKPIEKINVTHSVNNKQIIVDIT